ncbi:MAG: hypothetical protein ACYTHM_11205 [Planctomycetota bacterium]|jgi:hypothetical protein
MVKEKFQRRLDRIRERIDRGLHADWGYLKIQQRVLLFMLRFYGDQEEKEIEGKGGGEFRAGMNIFLLEPKSLPRKSGAFRPTLEHLKKVNQEERAMREIESRGRFKCF